MEIKRSAKFGFCPKQRNESESYFKVWDHGSGLADAIAEERKGFNQGDYKNMKDM